MSCSARHGWVRQLAVPRAQDVDHVGCLCKSGGLEKCQDLIGTVRRWPPTVRMAIKRPDLAQRVAVLGSTRNSWATSGGVSRSGNVVG